MIKSCNIIVLNYYGEKTISKTLDSLLNIDYPKNKFQITVVDNNSKDSSKKIINKYSQINKNIIPIFLDNNYGFARANNIGIRKYPAKYAVLLNNDCVVTKDWLKNLVKTASSNKKIFSVSSKIKLFPPEKNLIQNAGSIVFQDGYGRDIGSIVKGYQQTYEKDIDQFNNEKEVYSTCGASVLYNNNILNKIGLLDETFFMYYEDTEISERARMLGYKNYYSPKSVVFHNHAQSSKEWSPFFIYHTELGRLLHVFYNFPIRVFIKEYIKFTGVSWLRLVRNIKNKQNLKKSIEYLKVGTTVCLKSHKYLKKRLFLTKKYSQSARENNYQKILSGYWYFN